MNCKDQVEKVTSQRKL